MDISIEYKQLSQPHRIVEEQDPRRQEEPSDDFPLQAAHIRNRARRNALRPSSGQTKLAAFIQYIRNRL